MKNKILLATGLLSTVLWADFTLEFQMDANAKQVVQYKDAQHVKITTEEKGERGSVSQLIVGEKKFLVMENGGKKRYMDMDVMMAQMKQMGNMFSGEKEKSVEKAPQFKIIKKGTNKKVAGVDAQLWTVESKFEGKKEQMDIFVTDSKNVVDAVKKYTETMKVFTQMGGEEEDGFSSIFNIAPGHVTVSFEGMKLVKFDDANIPDTVYTLPKGMNTGKSTAKVAAVKKPPFCPMTGKHGEASQLNKMLKPEANGWKRIESGTCMNMMKMRVENVIYQKGDTYIHISLSVNVEGEQGIIATYKTRNMNVSDLQRGKIQEKRYQAGFLELVGQNAMDIKLSNAMITLTATKNVKDALPDFAKTVFDLSKFVAVKKSKANADDALKELGNVFGGKSAGKGEMPSNADMQKAGEMIKGLFGQ
jgi:hypothetical protein